MQRRILQHALQHRGLHHLTAIFALAAPAAAPAAPHVDFDFARAVECRDVTPVERLEQYPYQRLVEFSLPVSVRFREVGADDVEELTVEVNGVEAGLRVYEFAPATQMFSDVVKDIEATTTTKSNRSVDATLGGALPVPFAAKVANVTPSISVGAEGGQAVTEKLNRLPPKSAVVVSGTSLEGRGVFFKLKRYSQTSLEGVHELAVTFIVPAGWRGGEVLVGCTATGQRKVLFMKQTGSLGAEGDRVRLYLTNTRVVHKVAKPAVAEKQVRWQPNRGTATTAASLVNMVQSASPTSVSPAAKAAAVEKLP